MGELIAGTGKTYRLGKRIKFLVEKLEVSPDNITVITFTAAAAKNMRDRISDFNKPDLYLPYKKQPKSIRTMHSLGYKIVRENSAEIGLKELVKVVTSDRLRNILLGDAAQILGFDRYDFKDTAQCRQFGACKFSKQDRKCQICHTYAEILRSCSAIDYDEQILLACTVLKNDHELLARYQSQCRHLLIDEYQDSDVQLMSLQGAKGLEAKVVCVIGLEDGILPRADADKDALAEQSRLMFVSMTRAVVELHLFHARKRSGGLIFKNPYKEDGPPDIKRSRFLDHVPRAYKEDQYHRA